MKADRIKVFLIFALFFLSVPCFAQVPDELEFNLELSSPAVSIPKIYKSNIDLSGRGAHRDLALPQTIAAPEVLTAWEADLGFGNFYRLQYNLWEIQQLAKDKVNQEKLLSNYEEIIKKISASGGIVMLDLFGTPNGLGRVLDRNSAPHNLKAYKELVKNTIRKLSCERKYNIWYEVWSAPDLGDFFLGDKSEYLNLYRVIAEAVKELKQETKINIPLGGPSSSAWFKNIQPNNILTPEVSLIYELIKYCYSYRLPLDFISWHAYSSDPQEEKQDTIYNKSFIKLIREWLSYFHFDNNLPLIVDEWNFDASANVSAERGKNAYIAASFIPARLKNMYEAGLDNQIYFCLEDFGGNILGAIRNLGARSFDLAHPEAKGYTKPGYNIFRMLNLLGQELLPAKFSDEFVGVIATKSADSLALLIYNYIDPQAAMNYLSRNIIYLNNAERKAALNIINSDRMRKLLSGQLDMATLRLSPKTKTLFGAAVELNKFVNKFSVDNRKLKIILKGLKDTYIMSSYTVDNKCSRDCEFKASDEQDVDFNLDYSQIIELAPYSVQLLVFKKKPAPPVVLASESQTTPLQPADLASGDPALVLQPEVKPVEKAVEIQPAENIPEVKPEDAQPVVKEKNAEAK